MVTFILTLMQVLLNMHLCLYSVFSLKCMDLMHCMSYMSLCRKSSLKLTSYKAHTVPKHNAFIVSRIFQGFNQGVETMLYQRVSFTVFILFMNFVEVFQAKC
jgi:hypothetical protein